MVDSIAADERSLLDGPVDELLIAGADGRVVIDPATGLNKYGCAPHPRDALPLGSCTASSPSRRAVARARAVQQELLEAAKRGELHAVAHAMMLQQRVELARQLGVDRIQGAHVVLTPSGTDAEVIVTWLALRDQSSLLCNIVAAPAEVGSGTTLAAGGRHFDSLTPRGQARVARDPLAGTLSRQVRVQTIPLREEDGSVRDPARFDAETTRQVEAAIAEGQRVLLHLVAHSKTGVHAPRLSAVAALRERFGDRMMVLVDAAQGRMSRKGLQDALSAGYMLLFTGSKFYGGPPFAGAIILPPGVTPATLGVPALPPGARDYFTVGELPTEWTAACSHLSPAPNVGLVLRWSAALAEMKAYYEVSSSERYRILRYFERMVPEVLGASPCVTMDFVDPPVLEERSERLLESKTTVFPFYVHAAGAGVEQSLGRPALVRLHRWLNVDATDLQPGEEPEALRAEFHVGQPVVVSPVRPLAVLRIAMGGPLLVRLATDRSLGETLDGRMDWLRRQLAVLRRKLERLVPLLVAEETT